MVSLPANQKSLKLFSRYFQIFIVVTIKQITVMANGVEDKTQQWNEPHF